MIQPVILWTDALVFLLVVVVLAFALYARNKEHLRAPWRQVVRSRMAVASLVVLSAYTVTGLLDSMHFRAALPETAGQQQQLLATRDRGRPTPGGRPDDTGECKQTEDPYPTGNKQSIHVPLSCK